MGECETWAAVRSKAASDDCSPGTVSQTGKVHDIQILWGKKEKDLVLETQMHPDEQNSSFFFFCFIPAKILNSTLRRRFQTTPQKSDVCNLQTYGCRCRRYLWPLDRSCYDNSNTCTRASGRGQGFFLLTCSAARFWTSTGTGKKLPSPETCCT